MMTTADIATVAGRLRAPMCRPGLPLELEMVYRAEIDGDCRWSLERWWSREGAEPWRVPPWIMLNPSTADGRTNDPTLWRIIRWSWRWGFDGLLVVNLYPYRSPSPAELRTWLKRLDRDVLDCTIRNWRKVAELLRPYDAAMAAWGAQPGPFGDDVDFAVQSLLNAVDGTGRDSELKLFCIGETGAGQPKHPMARGVHRVPDDAVPIPFNRYPGTIVGLEKDVAFG